MLVWLWSQVREVWATLDAPPIDLTLEKLARTRRSLESELLDFQELVKTVEASYSATIVSQDRR